MTALSQLGRYRILGELGRGAMGVVYRAEDPALDRAVAIKTILLTGDAEERESYEARFMQEARAAGRLSHPSIVTIYDVGREGELAYMAMELLQGVDLRDRLRQGPVPVREALGLAGQVAEALAFAHEHGVVHRDIKPANIMIVHGDRAKIMDFGLARLPLSDVKTQTGVLLGTPKYMSPEQVAGRDIDHRSDIFALGTVLYEMLVGRPPFSAADTPQLIHRIATAAHAAPSRIVSSLPPIVDLIVARALEKDPDARYQSAREMAADLQVCLAELPESGAAPRSAADAADLDATMALAAEPSDRTEHLARTVVDGTERISAAALSAVADHWPVASRFDSSAAIQRLRQPSDEDSALFSHAPRNPNPIERLRRDRDLRGVAIAVALAALVAILVAVL